MSAERAVRREVSTTRQAGEIARACTEVTGLEQFVLWHGADRGVEIACGVRFEVVLEDGTIALRDREGRVIASRVVQDPFSDARALLSEIPGAFRAYGYMGFGLAKYGFHYEKAWPRLLHLVVPRVICQVGSNGVVLEGEEDAVEAAATAIARGPASSAATVTPGTDVVEVDRDAYCASLLQIQRAIRDGEVDKVILSRAVPLRAPLDPHATFEAIERRSPSYPYAYRLGNVTGAGACPGVLFAADGRGEVKTMPLAGTRHRGKTEEEDQRLYRELLADPKELSEHAMSIRHAYEELRPVVTPESHRVVDFMAVKRYPFTQHITSTAIGALRPGATEWDALRAVFPGVTVTGTPKADAVRFIDRYETVPRGNYGGAVGVVASDGSMEWGLAIRSVFDYGDGAVLNAGAGIVRDSDPQFEFDESASKMKTMASCVAVIRR